MSAFTAFKPVLRNFLQNMRLDVLLAVINKDPAGRHLEARSSFYTDVA